MANLSSTPENKNQTPEKLSIASWQPVTGSAVEYDIADDTTIIGGVRLDSGYGTGGAQRIDVAAEISTNLKLGGSVDGVSDVIVLAVQPLTNASFLGQIGWHESV